MWLEGGRVPRIPGFILVGSRRYAEWQNLAFQSSTDRVDAKEPELAPIGPMVDRPRYDIPTEVLRRDHGAPKPIVAQLAAAQPAKMRPEPEGFPRNQEDSSPRSETRLPDDEEVCYHEGGDLFAEDVERQLAILPEVVTATDEVTIEDIQMGDPESNTPEEIDRLRQIIWRRKYLLVGKGNALPPAAVGAVCDIDVGGAAPVVQRVRKVAPQFREKLSDLIKSLLSAKMIMPSTSPWASPIVIIIKKNGVDIRLCIDYRLVNSLTRLMMYPMPLISDLLEDLDKVLWYCLLDMASGFWVVSMTEGARKISAFITPFGLFEWTRMPFGLKNAPQIYHRLIDNALYGHFRIRAGHDPSKPIDVFESGEPEPEPRQSVLGRRSYIDDILVTAITWDMLCEKVEALLDTCERWNLSISVVKSFWGRRKVDYLGHRVSADGLEAHPKHLEVLGNLPFPQTLRSMQSFLGSLNYYSRFIEDFAVYAAILYELREADFHEIARQDRSIPSEQVAGGVVTRAEDADRWARAKIAFTMLKAKIVSTPVLKHFDPDRTPVIVVYASQWAISAALVQEHDASITPRAEVDEALIAIAPVKQPRQTITMPPPTIGADETLLVASFDGSARVKRSGGAYSAIIWKLPEWTISTAASEYMPDLTVNEAEYRGLLLCFDLLSTMDRGRIVICGDSNLVIRQMRGIVVTSDEDQQDLITLNRLDELLKMRDDDAVVRVSVVTRSTRRRRLTPEVLQETIVQRMRGERIIQAQNEEKWIIDLKAYLKGNVEALTAAEAKSCAKVANDYELDENDLLFYCPSAMQEEEDREEIAKLVVPETLQQDFLHHYYANCETGKGRPFVRGESPGNVQATYPFQIIAMDHIPSLPKSFKGNTELLIWVDLFSGYVIAKASASRTAQTIAENYEECVFRRFGASEAIRHDREPGFVSDFFRAFSRIVGQKQRATMAYRPQANGTAERMVQMLTRALKMYVADVNQQDWDEYAERLTFAINTAHDRVRGDTPFYLIHGWDPRSTLEAALPVGSTRRRDREPKRWRFHMQSQYRRATEQVNERLREAIQSRDDEHNQNVRSQEIEAGAQVWLYLDRVKEGYARKLAHMWHGLFRVVEMVGNHAARLETAGTEYRLFPIVHVSKLKLVRSFPDRPTLALTVVEGDRLDFDEAILPEDSWERSLGEDEYEVDRIVDVR
uniref:Uncharacterized protein n=1 Tax=Phytophthora ramorum TaxID=164328 RepID=H3H490_PHYRM